VDYLPLAEIRDDRAITVVYTEPVWGAVKSDLHHLDIDARLKVTEATEDQWGRLLRSVRGDVIYGVGGGLAADAAKYLAARQNLPLVMIPTALSVDAFFTWASGVRRNGTVNYLETKPPDRVLIDWRVIAAAPESIAVAGICDVLSIATGLWDWHLAEDKGQNPPHMAYSDEVARQARVILTDVLDGAEAAGRFDHGGLTRLVECLVREVRLCNEIGHSRPEEGSEHYFAYSAENVVGKGLPHGDLVGPGIVLIAALQEQDFEPLKRALMQCHLPLTNLSPDAVIDTLRELPSYARYHGLPYGIAHEIDAPMLNRLPSLE
jgi:glycerol-1-phosphate dehydrogenase [NAD(P)+]